MNNLVVIIIIVLGLSLIINSQDYDISNNKTDLNHLWHRYKEKFNKTYFGFHEDTRRKAWEANFHIINKHNEDYENGVHSFRISENHLTDLNSQSYLQKMVKLTTSVRRKLANPEVVGSLFDNMHNIPHEVDWRKEGFITPDYNQKDCGSCYAFSIALVLEAQIFKQTGKLVPLSAQQLVDCSVSSGNYGCGGGSLRNTLRYLEKSGGLMAYSDYPYVAKQKHCKFDKHRAMVNLSSWNILPARNEKALEITLATNGPVAASINASPHTFQLYHSGVYDDPFCTGQTVNHAMVVVGYTKDAWILKNWWGKHWGEKGYMRLKRGVNRCGIANYAAFAEV